MTTVSKVKARRIVEKPKGPAQGLAKAEKKLVRETAKLAITIHREALKELERY